MASRGRGVGRGGAQRVWAHTYFYDHPSRSTNPDDAQARHGTYFKAICRRCFDARVAQELQLDAETNVPNPRTAAEISQQLWAAPADGQHIWIQSRPVTLFNHLKACGHQPQEVRQAALNEAARSPSTGPRHAPPTLNYDATPLQPLIFPTPSGSGPPSSLGLQVSPFTAATPLIRTESAPSVLSSTVSSPSMLSFPVQTRSASTNASPALSAISSIEPLSALDSPNVIGFSGGSGVRKRRRDRTISQQVDDAGTGFSQELFEKCIARITASAGLPLRWVENPQWLRFLAIFIPRAIPPTRKVLTSRLIPAEHQDFLSRTKAALRGQEVTVQCDGWTGLNSHHYIAFRLTTGGSRQCYTVKVLDVSSEPKTASALLVHINDVIHMLHEVWQVVVVAVTTDASGESRKARKDLISTRASLVAPDCYAHQINLIVGDYLKSNSSFLEAGEEATELITWLRSKTRLLALLREIQMRQGARTVAVLRAVLTRWTAHYLAYRRLLELRPSLMMLIQNDETEVAAGRESFLVTGDRRAKEKARDMKRLIQNGLFWHNLARIKRHLEPLAVAANITQATQSRLDDVLMVLGFLYLQFTSLCDAEDGSAKEAVLASLDKRWAKADQSVFIAAVVLHPGLMISPFRKEGWNTRAGLYTVFGDLHKRFFPDDPIPPSLSQDIKDYLDNRGEFIKVHTYAASKGGAANCDPWEIWDSSMHAGDKAPLVRLAKRIFSICPNSASCERLFSAFGNVLTKLRSRLGNEMLSRLSELKMFLKDEEDKDQEVRKRLRRHFGPGVHTTRSNLSSSTPTTATTAATGSESGLPSMSTSYTNSSLQTAGLSRSTPSFSPLPNPSNPGLIPIDPGLQTPQQSYNADASEPAQSDAALVSTATSTIARVTEELSRLCDDEDDATPVSFARNPIPIPQLFDFSNNYWVKMYEDKASKGLEQELELCELLDLDADGEIVDGEDTLAW